MLKAHHHGYSKHHNTTTVLLEITDIIYQSADRNLITSMMTINEISTFECINPHILDRKLETCNISDEERTWFKSYLNHQSQYVMVGKKISNMTAVTSGFPQGSISGPLIYTQYTGELPNIINKQEECNIEDQEPKE